ncbi:MAG: c-type cytochrome, methanol metabolism-related [Hyphomicrobiales bacterium]|nr:c-type cytochrome, methanol metabolism-related [Hyphomicrobiales bacterium]
MKPFMSGALALAFALGAAGAAFAEPPGDPKAVKTVDGKSFDAKGDPTYNIKPDGTVDFYTFSGYRRYMGNCSQCHGPDGMGSSYAPALADSLKTIGYAEFAGIVIGGRQNVGGGNEKVMPALGDDKNVTCYLDDIYIYLRARSNDAVPRGRPDKHDPKPPAFEKAETECMGVN